MQNEERAAADAKNEGGVTRGSSRACWVEKTLQGPLHRRTCPIPITRHLFLEPEAHPSVGGRVPHAHTLTLAPIFIGRSRSYQRQHALQSRSRGMRGFTLPRGDNDDDDNNGGLPGPLGSSGSGSPPPARGRSVLCTMQHQSGRHYHERGPRERHQRQHQRQRHYLQQQALSAAPQTAV